MQTLVDLVKLGAIGASLAFLYLSYQLLKSQSSLKDANNNPVAPQPDILREISKFRNSALVFLIVGVLSEFLLSNSANIVQHLFRTDLTRVRFSGWDFFPENNMIAFDLTEDRMDTGWYVLGAQARQYDLYIAVRKRDGTPYDHGEYKILLGPYRLMSQGRIEKKFTAQEQESLGSACIDFAAFGIERQDGKPVAISMPFNPDKMSAKIVTFHTAFACNEENAGH